MTEPEFFRPVHTERLPELPIEIEADEHERAALARRFALCKVERLRASVALERADAGIRVAGDVVAAIEQDCAVSGEAFATEVSERFELLYVPPTPTSQDDEEYELSADELDHIVMEGDTIDIGEAVAQTLAMAIDPYARGPAADIARERAGLENDEDRPATGPLADALKGLSAN